MRRTLLPNRRSLLSRDAEWESFSEDAAMEESGLKAKVTLTPVRLYMGGGNEKVRSSG
jgi:hypothetical protein